jgi:regulator of replication initiation timing
MAITHQIQQDVQSKMQQLNNDFFAQIQQIKQDFTNQMFQQQIQVQMLKQQINSNNAQKDYLYLELQSLRSEVQFQGVEIKKEKRSKYNGKQKQKGNQSREQVKQVPPRSENTTYNNTETIDNPTIQSEEASIKTTSINYDEEPVIKPISLCVQPYGETLVQSITPHGETLVQSITPPGETLVQSFTVYPEEEMVEEPVVKLCAQPLGETLVKSVMRNPEEEMLDLEEPDAGSNSTNPCVPPSHCEETYVKTLDLEESDTEDYFLGYTELPPQRR